MLISFIAAPENAPQTAQPTPKPARRWDDPISERILALLAEQPDMQAKLWALINQIALEHCPRSRAEERRCRLEVLSHLNGRIGSRRVERYRRKLLRLPAAGSEAGR